MYIYPKPGATIIDPVRGDVIPPEGREVDDGAYWTRRVRDGDVVQVAPPAQSINAADVAEED